MVASDNQRAPLWLGVPSDSPVPFLHIIFAVQIRLVIATSHRQIVPRLMCPAGD